MTTDTYTFTGNERESVAFTPTLDGTVYNCGEVEYRGATLVHPDHRQFRQYHSEHPRGGLYQWNRHKSDSWRFLRNNHDLAGAKRRN